MRHNISKKLYSKWSKIYNENEPTSVKEFSLEKFEKEISNIFTLKSENRKIIFQFSGSNIENIIGKTVTKTNFYDIWGENSSKYIYNIILNLSEEQDPIIIGFKLNNLYPLGKNSEETIGEILLLPINSTDGNIAIGSMSMLSAIPYAHASTPTIELTSLKIYNTKVTMRGTSLKKAA